MVAYGHKIEEEVKTMQSEIKQNVQENNSDEKENRTHINNWDQKGEINIQSEQNEGTRILKNEKRLRKLWDNFKSSNIRIIRVPEREQEQEVENLFEQIIQQNFPNLAKEIGLPGSPGSSDIPKNLNSRKHKTKHIIITLSKIKTKERILKTAREKETVTYKEVPTTLLADFSKGTLQVKGAGKKYSKS